MIRTPHCLSRRSGHLVWSLWLCCTSAPMLGTPSVCAECGSFQWILSQGMICLCDDQVFVSLLLSLFMLFAFLNKGNLQLQFKFPLAKFSPKIKCSSGGCLEQESGRFLFPSVHGQSFLFAWKVELACPSMFWEERTLQEASPHLLLEEPHSEF